MHDFDCLVIGAGPGGYVAAIRASQLGLRTAVVERALLGGQCLNWGCIPSKTLMESAKLFHRVARAAEFGVEGVDPAKLRFNWTKALRRKDRIVRKLVKGVEFLMKKNSVTVLSGEAVVLGPGRVQIGDVTHTAKNILVASGAVPDDLAFRGLDPGLVLSVPRFYETTEMPEILLVFGTNGAACETAVMLRLAGVEVSLAGPGERLLPFLDGAMSDYTLKRFRKLGISVHLGIDELLPAETGVRAGDEILPCEAVVNCADRRAVLPRFEDAVPELTGDGFIRIDEFARSSIPGIYAAGDVAGQLWAQAASAQGTAAVSHMAGLEDPLDYNQIPKNIYMDPEIATVGLSEEEVRQQGIGYRVGEFSLSVNGKALAEGNTEGFVKVLAEDRYGEVIGVHVVAANATDLISEAVAHLKLEATLEDVARVIHAHPTLSEAFWEASFDALDRPLHK